MKQIEMGLLKVERIGEGPNPGWALKGQIMTQETWVQYRPSQEATALVGLARMWKGEGMACGCGRFLTNTELQVAGALCSCGAPVVETAERLAVRRLPKFGCLACGHEMATQAVVALSSRGQGCPKCGADLLETSLAMTGERIVAGAVPVLIFEPAKMVHLAWKGDELLDPGILAARKATRTWDIVPDLTLAQKEMGEAMGVTLSRWAFNARSETFKVSTAEAERAARAARIKAYEEAKATVALAAEEEDPIAAMVKAAKEAGL